MVKVQYIAGWGLEVPEKLGGERRGITPEVYCADPDCPWQKRMEYMLPSATEFCPLPQVRNHEGKLVTHDSPAPDYEWTPEEGDELFELGGSYDDQKFVSYYLLRLHNGPKVHLRYSAMKQHFHARIEIIGREELPRRFLGYDAD